MPIGLLILLVIGLVAAVFIGFGAMVVVVTVKTIAFACRRINALLWKPGPIVHPTFYCTQIRCHTANPASARFCRRCGAPAQSRVVYRMSYGGIGSQAVVSKRAAW